MAFDGEAGTVQCIAVVVRPDPGALPRVIEPFAKLGLVPLSVTSRLFAEAEKLAIDIQIAGMTRQQGQRVATLIGSWPTTLQVVLGSKVAQE